MAAVFAKQTKTFGPYRMPTWHPKAVLTATVRFDDECGNGHNTFSITGEIGVPKAADCLACGCLHEEIAKVIPSLAPYIQYHLCSDDGPLHYIANTVYWVKKGNLEHARSTAIWPDATDEELTAPGLETRLQDRLPQIIAGLRQAVESLGLRWEP